MKFTPTNEQIVAAETAFLAKAHLSLIEPIVRAYQRKILASNRWKADPEHCRRGESEVILDPKDAYLLPDDVFAVYDAQCKASSVAAGLHVDDPRFCPLLVAEEQVRLAERALVDEIGKTVGVTADQLIRAGLANYRKFVELNLKLMAPFVDHSNIMGRFNKPESRVAFDRPSA